MPDFNDIQRFGQAFGTKFKSLAEKDWKAVSEFANDVAEQGKKIVTDPQYREDVWEAAKETARDMGSDFQQGAKDTRDAVHTAFDYYSKADSDRFTRDLTEVNEAAREIPEVKDLQDASAYAQDYYGKFDMDRFTKDLENIDKSTRDQVLESRQQFEKQYNAAAAQGKIPQYLGSGAAVVVYEGGKEIASNIARAKLAKGVGALGAAGKRVATNLGKKTAAVAQKGAKKVRTAAKKAGRALKEAVSKPKHAPSAIQKCKPRANSNTQPVRRRNHMPDIKNKRLDLRAVADRDGSITYFDKYGRSVTYNARGYPDFSKHAMLSATPLGLDGSDADFDRANAFFGLPKTPTGYTWHHVEDCKTLLLIPQDIHQTFQHSGGAALLKSGQCP